MAQQCIPSLTETNQKKTDKRFITHPWVDVNARAGTVMCVPGVKIKQHSDALIVLLEC